ncbi:lycopene cyclase domain-containing protein [Candidatus Bathyarchaeota archaeon]|nr:lycopene cyclase domain-containing protein [Candidatus Bathyarchaeota archaeon]
MSFYFYLNLAIIAFPIIFSFERHIRFYRKLKPLAVSLLLVGIFFVVWDIFATYRGHWSFNSLYVNQTKVFGLPLEEIMFFITVPYSCLFVFDAIGHFLGDKKLFTPRKWISAIIAVFIIMSAFGFYGEGYTFLAIISIGLTILFVTLVNVKLFSSRSYWIYTLLTLSLFLIFNYILTSYPVVQYSSNAITGIRVLTIPIEDFMFNFSMLTSYLTVYLWASKKLRIGTTNSI